MTDTAEHSDGFTPAEVEEWRCDAAGDEARSDRFGGASEEKTKCRASRCHQSLQSREEERFRRSCRRRRRVWLSRRPWPERGEKETIDIDVGFIKAAAAAVIQEVEGKSAKQD